jgi:homoserine kinase type II
MAVYTILDRKTLVEVTESYALGRLVKSTGVPAGSVNTHYLLETQKGKFFLKIEEVKSVPEVQRELDLLLFLRAQGLCCPQPLADRQGHYLHKCGGKTVSLYYPLPGNSLSEAQLTPLHLEKVGRVLASLHLLGQGYNQEPENRFSPERVMTLYQGVREQLPGYFKHLTSVLDDEVAHQQQYLEDKLPKGVIHGDLFADNLLFRRDKLVGVLDFEAACYGKFLYDLATAVNALCYNDGRYLIERFKALLNGYQSVRILSLAEWDVFPTELRFSALRFTVTRLKDFFLRPMDNGARVNKDFREFFERLQILRRERPGGMDRLLLAMATGYDYRKYQKVPTPQPTSDARHRTESTRTDGRQCLRSPKRTKTTRRLLTARKKSTKGTR